MDSFLNKKEAAEFCKVSVVTLHRWIADNSIRCIKINGRVLFLKSHLIEDLQKFEKAPKRDE
jgi:predicted site-specific integrase-resolvase